MPMKLVVFGTRCDFAEIVLRHLVSRGHQITAFLIPGRHEAIDAVQALPASNAKASGSRLPMARSSATRGASIAGQAITRTFALNRPHDGEVRDFIESLNADFAIVCCYPGKLPVGLVEPTRYGGLNVHPSLLPEYRGPDPLFWVYRNGERTTGVTIHRLAERLDAGAIVRQEPIAIPIGMPGNELWEDSARLGASLLDESIEMISAGNAQETQQDERRASYYSWPASHLLSIHPSEWSAWRLYHFCRGVLPLGHMLRLANGGHTRRILSALSYSKVEQQPDPSSATTGWVRCTDGWVELDHGPAIF